jgi:pilus assembly protein CpaB
MSSPSFSPKPQRNKRALLQLGLAIAIAVVCAVVTVGAVVMLLMNVSKQSEGMVSEAREEALLLKEQLDELKASSEAEQTATLPQVVTTTALATGSLLQPNDVTLTHLPKAQANAAGLSSVSEAVGKVLTTPLAAGEPLLSNHLASAGVLSAQLPLGYRAIAIALDPVGGLGGDIVPGAFVDVLVSVTQQQNALPTVKTLLQRAKVLSINNGVSPLTDSTNAALKQNKGGLVVTLAVRPEEAEKLALSQQLGVFHLSLRSPTDTMIAVLPGSQFPMLVGAKERSNNVGAGAALVANNPLMGEPSTRKVSVTAPTVASAPTGNPPYIMEVIKGIQRDLVSLPTVHKANN